MHHAFAYTFINTPRNTLNPPAGKISYHSPNPAFIQLANSGADIGTTSAQSIRRV
jgi:hypothetical protein